MFRKYNVLPLFEVYAIVTMYYKGCTACFN